MRNIELIREILKLADHEAYGDNPTLKAIRELIAKERPTLTTEQDAHNKDQMKLEGIE